MEDLTCAALNLVSRRDTLAVTGSSRLPSRKKTWEGNRTSYTAYQAKLAASTALPLYVAIAASFFTSSLHNTNPIFNIHLPFLSSHSSPLHLRLSLSSHSPSSLSLRHHHTNFFPLFVPSASLSGGDGGFNNRTPSGGGGGGNDDNNGNNSGSDEDGDNAGNRNRKEAMMVLTESKRTMETLPNDLVAAIQAGRIPGAVVSRFLDLEKSGIFRWLLQFGGFKERLLADDLFFAKVGIECGVGIFSKTAAEYERRRENFFKELEIVFADVVMAIIADFMLVYLPAPTVSLRPPLTSSTGPIAKFFYNCPDNAFQHLINSNFSSYMLRVTVSSSIMQRNGAKLFAAGTTSSLVGTVLTNALINARKAVDKSSAGEVENVPILSTSVAYGVYMAVSSNLRYQVLAGVIEQRILEPLLHQHKLMLSAICFAVRTGNTYLGSLLWVDHARLIGIQKAKEEQKELA
ncbi:protein RETICULATA-RELATED 4, chloroplastic [Hevea brasiliensis]|uniref:protein RETICULATA-RELATED 4, chloroplastic n=1 Tax=Hevea brasiliensis TaxID=3981 RepID=UPI0025D96E21|nr:protein RETICULATA-RELATED 4, chloroplastic [Hevea brasiliensis]